MKKKTDMNIQPTAIVEKDVTLGNGTYIWHFTHIMSGAKLGVSCIVGDSVFIGRKVIIGDRVKICNGANIPEGVILKDDVFIGSNVSFKNVRYPKAYRKATELLPTIVEESVTIDANATIMPGIVIGKNSTVGAGALVIRSVPAEGLYVSQPAECKCKKDTCPECSKREQKKLLKIQKYARRQNN